MGRDKARLKINGVTMLARIRAVAERAFPGQVRVLRKDRVRRCGPLGGLVTALQTSRTRAVLFLACDMPLVSAALLRRIARASHDGQRAVFATQKRRVGFPLLLPAESLAVAENQIATKEFPLQSLALALHARRLIVRARSRELCNVNTPEDVARLRARPAM